MNNFERNNIFTYLGKALFWLTLAHSTSWVEGLTSYFGFSVGTTFILGFQLSFFVLMFSNLFKIISYVIDL